MRHRVSGRKLGRNASHRRAMFRNMAVSLIRSVRAVKDVKGQPKVAGRIITTLPKAKELRPIVEKLVTLARKAAVLAAKADQHRTTAVRNSDAWNEWRASPAGREWVLANAPAEAMRRRAFAALRDEEAVEILFSDLARRFADRAGGYTRVVRLSGFRLGDAAQKALIEFVGERDRVQRTRRRAAPAVVRTPAPSEPA